MQCPPKWSVQVPTMGARSEKRTYGVCRMGPPKWVRKFVKRGGSRMLQKLNSCPRIRKCELVPMCSRDSSTERRAQPLKGMGWAENNLVVKQCGARRMWPRYLIRRKMDWVGVSSEGRWVCAWEERNSWEHCSSDGESTRW